jgi:hypothetical protein
VKKLVLLACLALAYASSAAAAPSLRCEGRIIRVGAPAAYVLAICGEPANQVLQESVARAATASGSSRLVGLALSEQWIYERGWGHFPAVLFFLDGKLKRIDFLPYRSNRTTSG